MCLRLHRTGSVRPTTLTAWPKDSRWHSPTRGVGPGSGGGVLSVALGEGEGVVSATGSVGDEVQALRTRTTAATVATAPHPITRAASVPPSSYADSRSGSPTSPSTSSTGAA